MAREDQEPTRYVGGRDANGGAVVSRHRPDSVGLLYVDREWTGGALVSLEWGAAGPGAELLALAILSDVLGATGFAALWCEDYAREVVGAWPRAGFTTDSNAVCVWLVRKTLEGLHKRGEEAAPCWRRQRLFGPGCSELKRPSNWAGGGGGH